MVDPKVVKIYWDDAAKQPEIMDIPYPELKPLPCRLTGFLLEENDEYLVVVSELVDTRGQGFTLVPRRMVKEIRYMEEK